MADPTPHKPTASSRAEVAALCSFGIPQVDIGKYLGIDSKTLRKHYREELDTGVTRASAEVGKFLYRNATGKTLEDGASHSDCVRAAMFWAKTRMGFKETSSHELSSPDGSMSPTTILIKAADVKSDD